jgi:hypothetical protein
MYSIGVDFHKAYSHMIVMDAQAGWCGRVRCRTPPRRSKPSWPPIAVTRRPSSKPRVTGP